MSVALTAVPPAEHAARELLETSLRTHGVARWDTLSGLRFSMLARGPLLLMRGKSFFRRRYTVEVDTREPRAVLAPFGAGAGRGIYAYDSVRIESANGEVIAERDGARAHARSHLRWDDLDLLYLLGYSFWSYHSFPFLFRRPDLQLLELAPVRERRNGPWLHRLHVRFPAGLPVHCAEQVFFFNEQGLIIRFDYSSDLFQPSARGSHLCTDYRNHDGLMIPGHRRAVPWARGSRAVPFLPTLMEAHLSEFELLSENSRPVAGGR